MATAKKRKQAGAVEKTQESIKKSLIEQLRAKGANVAHFMSLIDDYIFYYQQEKKMQADIRKNGRTVEAVSAKGVIYDRDNPAIKDAVLYNKQKLAILNELGLKTDACTPKEDEL
jgi:hypothetical protein